MQVTQPAPLPGECSPATEYAQVPVQGKDGKYLRPSTVNLILLQCTCVCVRFWCQPTFALASLPTSHRGALTPVQRLNYRSCIHLFGWFRSSIWFHMKGCITKYIEGSYQWNVTIGTIDMFRSQPQPQSSSPIPHLMLRMIVGGKGGHQDNSRYIGGLIVKQSLTMVGLVISKCCETIRIAQRRTLL